VAQGGGRSPFQISLRASERRALKRSARSQAAPYRQVVRARIVLDAAAGLPSMLIARRVGVTPNTVRKWRKRFCTHGYAGLRDRPRPGRPRVFAAAVVAEVKAIACELPATRGVPVSRWSLAELRAEVIASGLAAEVSTATVRRWLAQDAIKPWQHRSWVFPRDPDFAAKATRVLDLYARVFQGQGLGSGEYVISADEKTSIQARCRCHPTLPPGRTRVMRVEHEYDRGGALAYLAAWEVHRGRLFGRCEPTTGIEPFGRLVEQVMTVEPYASAKRVFWVVDNGSSHRGQASVDRLQGQWPNLRLVPPAGPRVVVEPDRDLLLGRAAQGRVTQRLHRPGRGPSSPAGLPAPLRADRHPVRLALHPMGPGPAAAPLGRPRAARTGRMTTTHEPTKRTT
jgi:transposase